jgi:hypothetical protein
LSKAEQIFLKMNRQKPSLLFCILMDLIGYASNALHFFGEIADIFWAPISGIIFFISFGGWKGALGGVGNLIEEILPGTDFIPSFTIMWFVQDVAKRKQPSSVSAQ